MVFSSPIFLFLFLPLALAGAWLCGRRLRNAFLFIVSLLFYAWGEPVYVLLMVFSIIGNYLVALRIDPGRGDPGQSRRWLVIGVAMNLLLLGHFKYTNFLVENLNGVLAWAGLPGMIHAPISLPIGISFYTFHALSYLVDVYRRDAEVQRNLVNLGMYIAMFSQLVAGPIIRYGHVADQIEGRVVTIGLFASGTTRFLIGLGKKMLLANPLGEIADTAFSATAEELTPALAWVGIAAYAFQIYFDFSGYSDMAIGLGRMFGFRYRENFDYPYISTSLREFWRRWHISLSSWFRDYLYIPLGGNRVGPRQVAVNLLLVFTLCGLWHGASWNFLIWGWMHGAVLVLERVGLERLMGRVWRPFAHLYTLVVVLVLWVFFRADTLASALAYLGAMFDLSRLPDAGPVISRYLGWYYLALFAAAAFGSTPAGARLGAAVTDLATTTARPGLSCAALNLARLAWLGGVGYVSAVCVASETYNPFIYFRF